MNDSATKAEPIKRYCIRENRMCEYANSNGCCSVTGCKKGGFEMEEFGVKFPDNLMEIIEKTFFGNGYKVVKENKSERMQLLIRPTTKDAIRELAAEQGLSMNDLVNNIFEEYIERHKQA